MRLARAIGDDASIDQVFQGLEVDRADGPEHNLAFINHRTFLFGNPPNKNRPPNTS
jgi:hypothetical protein